MALYSKRFETEIPLDLHLRIRLGDRTGSQIIYLQIAVLQTFETFAI